MIKNDRLDARMLARLGRVDVNLLARSASARGNAGGFAVVRSREALVDGA